MKIDFKKPRYIVPLIAIPFLCLFFFVFRNSTEKKGQSELKKEVNGNLAEISDQAKDRGLSDKLEAYRESFKAADGYSAINTVNAQELPQATMASSYSEKEKLRLDSIEAAIKSQAYLSLPGRSKSTMKIPAPGASVKSQHPEDRAVAQALASLAEANSRQRQSPAQSYKESDPMDLFKKQMAYMDSMGKANDPAFIAEQKVKKEKLPQQSLKVLPVSRSAAEDRAFNTLRANESPQMITAIIDEDITGYAGSRIRLRLLEEIYAGKMLLPAGSYLYARISGFSEQRIQLEVNSVLSAGKILPVRLQVYDMDGLSGLYVPASAFREFSKSLGSSPIQGFSTMGSSQTQSEFLMSTADRLFQSTSSAIAGMIRKNRAKLKYNNQVFLIDPQDLQNQK